MCVTQNMFLPINVVADYKTCSNIFGFRSSQKLTIPKSLVSQKKQQKFQYSQVKKFLICQNHKFCKSENKQLRQKNAATKNRISAKISIYWYGKKNGLWPGPLRLSRNQLCPQKYHSRTYIKVYKIGQITIQKILQRYQEIFRPNIKKCSKKPLKKSQRCRKLIEKKQQFLHNKVTSQGTNGPGRLQKAYFFLYPIT